MANTSQQLPREPVSLWFWTTTSDTYPFKRRKTTWRMTDEDARTRHGDAMKVEGSLFVTSGAATGFRPGYVHAREPGEDDEYQPGCLHRLGCYR